MLAAASGVLIVACGIGHIARAMCISDATKCRQLDVLLGSGRVPGVHAPADGAVSPPRCRGRQLSILSAATLNTESRHPAIHSRRLALNTALRSSSFSQWRQKSNTCCLWVHIFSTRHISMFCIMLTCLLIEVFFCQQRCAIARRCPR